MPSVPAPPATIDLRQAIAIDNPKAIELWLDVVTDPTERSRELTELSRPEIVRFSELLPVSSAVEVVDTLDLHAAVQALRIIPLERGVLLLTALETDRAAELLRELTPEEREPLLVALPAERASALRSLLTWPDDTAAAHMVPDALTVDVNLTAAEAVDEVRNHPARLRQDSHIGAYVFAVEHDGRIAGVLSFRNLVLAEPSTPVSTLVDEDVLTVGPLTDQEEAARLLVKQRLLAIPVVDDEHRLLGVLTADDASDIVEEEATEDAERQGGSEPLDVPYLRASPWLLWRKRIIWLLVLFVAEAYTGTVLRAFEDELDAVVALAFFIPLLIGTGGNTGTQITTTLIRAMSTENVRLRDVGKVLGKELTTGLLISVAMAAAGLIRAWTLGVEVGVMVTVALSLAAIVLWSSLIASILPLALKKLRIDPAVVSAPMISTIVDGTGLLIYFLIAKLTLPELAGL